MQAHCGRPSARNNCREVRHHHHRADHELTCKPNKGVMVDDNKAPAQSVLNKCREVLKHHNYPVDHLSDHELTSKLNKGVIVDGNKKFWMDKNHRLCVELFARALDISQSSNLCNWKFRGERLSSGDCIEVAELREVTKLEVKGLYDAKMLTPNTEYDVYFNIKLNLGSQGFSYYKVKCSLTNVEGRKTETSTCLEELGGRPYYGHKFGKFRSPSEGAGESKIEFKMEQCDDLVKEGLVVKSVAIC